MSSLFGDSTASRIIEQARWAEGFPRTRHGVLDRPFSFGTNEWWPCKSQAASDCPAHGLAAVVDLTTLSGDDRPILLVDQPSTTLRRQYVLIGPDGMKANDYGAATFGPRARFAYDSGTPALDETWGAKPNQWTASKNYPGLVVAGIVDATSKIAFGRFDDANTADWIEFTLPSAEAAGTASFTITAITSSPTGSLDPTANATTVTILNDLGLAGASGDTCLALRRDATHYVWIAIKPSDAFNIRGRDLKTLSGYDATKNQFLMNLVGTFEWVTAGACT